ncbi:MAG: helix-turn-helix domain-containing protein [Bacteriovoracaceae bacterium]|jgi:transcriptional regulator with XRE-family HTH domain|nr:helix-turn-helix domain-containing protein [Bacteriovoracaceae bacterium]
MQEIIQSVIKSKFESIRNRNPSYSLRAFSSKLGISPGAASTIMNGKRKISQKMALRLASNLGLNEAEREEFMSPFTYDQLAQFTGPLHKKIKAISTFFEGPIDWYHLGILNIVMSESRAFSADEISQRLCLDGQLVRLALSGLAGSSLLSSGSPEDESYYFSCSKSLFSSSLNI